MDMGQADRTLRSQAKPKPFTWFEVKPKAHIVRGDVCVIRRMNGSPEMFKIVEQHSYKEWLGCWSAI